MDLNEYFIEKASERELFTSGCFLMSTTIMTLNNHFYIRNILNNFKNNLKGKSISRLKESIGKGKGEPFTFDKLIFCGNNLDRPVIDYNEKYCFDYRIFLMILKTYSDNELSFFISKNKKEEPVLKIYRKNKLLALFLAMEK